ncbi:MAG TPA: indolepyruvate oxidoreductase subunit beta family protein [Stellaceae bacterium]|nr:indolepyruvate oxidoreductase subunit beta family protein [Stellaceae bacterium]
MTDTPVKILIAALGGEGGAVLTNWIVAAADSLGYPVQSTSIPGVAQRTGATTYYIEILPRAVMAGEKRPVMALVPGIGDVDIVVTSELLEAGRAIGGGFVTPDRTQLVASTHRIYAMAEKIEMGDGRLDSEKLLRVIGENAQSVLLFDMEDVAQRHGAMINAVMLGAVAGSERLPLPDGALAAAIAAEGKAAEANLKGFRAGLEAARRTRAEAQAATQVGQIAYFPTQDEFAAFPHAARGIIVEGVNRLAAYQNADYAQHYLRRLAQIMAADRDCGADGKLLAETARHLALRMSFEDVIRVAEAKLDPARMKRIAREVDAKPGEPVAVIEFFKPGIEEMATLLPSFIARPILRVAARRGWLGTVYWGMNVRTTSISGFLKLRFLVGFKRLRPWSHRFREEQRAIDIWLGLVARASEQSAELGLEVADCAGLIKGYGDTLKRGQDNYRTIVDRIIGPAIAGKWSPRQSADAVASARAAALADPEGESLARCLGEIEGGTRLGLAAE